LAKALEVSTTVTGIFLYCNDSLNEALEETISDALEGCQGYNIQSTGEVCGEFIGSNNKIYIYIYIHIYICVSPSLS